MYTEHKPKKPVSPFLQYVSNNYENFKNEYSNAEGKLRLSEVRKAWNDCPSEEKTKLSEDYKAQMESYAGLKAKWDENHLDEIKLKETVENLRRNELFDSEEKKMKSKVEVHVKKEENEESLNNKTEEDSKTLECVCNKKKTLKKIKFYFHDI